MKKIDRSFYRFLIVGVINTIVGTSIMFIAYNGLGVSYWGSTFLNYFIGSIVSYFLNKYYTFKQTEKSYREIILFVINIACCYFVAYFLAIRIVELILVEYSSTIISNVSMAVGMCLFVVLNYIGQRIFVFKFNK
jgi:putative flippase GtrA